MSTRELIVLGTAGAVPTRRRNHNGYLLRWDGRGVLFDPGEGTQRQMAHAGASATEVHWLCVTHFHGDHSLGVPGIVQRLGRDGVPHDVHAVFPAEGIEYWERLKFATSYYGSANLVEHPVSGAGETVRDKAFSLTALPLSHSIPTYGYRLAEPDGRTFLPEKLREHGISGAAVRELSGPLLAECSAPKPGQKVAFVMDTRLCDNVFALAADVDMLIIESTFLDSEVEQAHERGHLTARQAGEVARACGVRTLVLTHFSERYTPADDQAFLEQADFPGAVLAHDLDRVPLPGRRTR
ncbi:ribonuclease Z [Nocardia caishijiensis]|uniref:Ribonuclease Z n=1 Tax=Nocardia caishijiensis TaxID=184756 RepID=A0ABQ6YIS3_9NOCA|nr:ribonuclease Z [Nocardia caishijiensis]KAF0845693.1 ribonuclease Z [Nocardia caishijiensis]